MVEKKYSSGDDSRICLSTCRVEAQNACVNDHISLFAQQVRETMERRGAGLKPVWLPGGCGI